MAKGKIMKKENKLIILSVACAAVVFVSMLVAGKMTQQPVEAPVGESVSETEKATEKPASVNLLAVGDNLIHDTIISAGLKSDGSYDFNDIYSEMKSTVSAADIAVINQETVLGGNKFEYSGYPLFNSPQEIGDASIAAGFDVFLGATNHSMDKGSAGIFSEIEYYEKHPEVTYLGVNKDEQEYKTVKVVEKNGIKIAMLNYTFGLNGLTLPSDKPWLVDMLSDKDKMKADIDAAKSQADVVIVFPHWGTEYSMEISTSQEDYTTFFAENGVDIVIGAHPHVVEPVKEVAASNGDKMLVYYSLGNFISHQNGTDRMLGGMANITITKTGEAIDIKGTVVPLVTHIEKQPTGWMFKVYKLSDYTDQLAKAHKESGITLTYLNDLSTKTFGDFIEK